MPRTKKAVADAVAETPELTVAAEEVKPAKKPRAAKKAASAAKASAPRTKKAALNAKVVIELGDKKATPETLVERAKNDWQAKGNAVEDMKDLSIYVNASEGTVYYVVNDDYLSGSFDF